MPSCNTSATLAEVAVIKTSTISNTLDRAIKDAQALSEHLQPVRRRIQDFQGALAVLTNSLDGLLQAIQSNVNVTKFRALVKSCPNVLKSSLTKLNKTQA